MKKRIFYVILASALGLNLLIGAQIYFTSVQAADKNDLYQKMELFAKVLEKVRQEYVDSDKVTYDDLVYGALKGMLGTLDPHSEFMEPQKYEDLKNDTEGAFGGVGIVIEVRDKTLTVVAPMEDTPAYKAGVLAGDKILKIDGKSTENFTLVDAVKHLRGEPGSPVTLTVIRPGAKQPKDYTLNRAVIKVDTVKDLNGHREFPLGENKIGYVRILQFGEQTAGDLEEALNKMQKQGMRGLVMDLRNNPGGLLDQAVKVCDLFLPKGKPIVSTEGRGTLSKFQYIARSRDHYPNLKIVLLVNVGSASASEIVAGCLQDLGRAFLMGEQTFGKGSVQSIIPLQDGSALRLTTAKYYTPSHKVIHEHGIVPDSIVPMSSEEELALVVKRTPGGFDRLDDAQRSKLPQIRDVQLDRATDFLKGMLLYEARANHPSKVASK